MNLKRQLLLVSLLTLVLPWAGCQFITETESALRSGQQQMLAGTARAIADSLAKYPEEFPLQQDSDFRVGDQLYGHRLQNGPSLDGYFDDWMLDRDALRGLRGINGPIRFALGLYNDSLYIYVEVSDSNVIYATQGTIAIEQPSRFSDRIRLVSSSPPYLEEALVFSAEAPGAVVTYRSTAYGFAPEPRALAFWQDVPGGYRLEARIPTSLLGTHLGLVVSNTNDPLQRGVQSASYAARTPGAFVTDSPDLRAITAGLAQPAMRLIVTDALGWRLASVGDVSDVAEQRAGIGSTWLRIAYSALVESGEAARLAEPDASGREQQGYIAQALNGTASVEWYRSADSGRAVVAVAQPIIVDGTTVGSVVLQQGTDAILSLRNQGLTRLMNVTLIATLLVAAALLGYATWLSRRIRHLSVAAEDALETDQLRQTLPSALAGDEIGDLSRSFSYVLQQLGEYNDYLRSLASKLSHELRTPLAIVTSSLENLEHENLDDAAAGYASRARDGADRLRRILTAMSEASRVEELMAHAEAEVFDLLGVLQSTVAAYRDVYPARGFQFETEVEAAAVKGSPELLIQMLDKLVDNAVDFSADGDVVKISLRRHEEVIRLSVTNPGPQLPDRMRAQLFDSMVSVRSGDDRHLGLGLYVAKLIAEGHNGSIDAENTGDGVCFTVLLPQAKEKR